MGCTVDPHQPVGINKEGGRFVCPVPNGTGSVRKGAENPLHELGSRVRIAS